MSKKEKERRKSNDVQEVVVKSYSDTDIDPEEDPEEDPDEDGDQDGSGDAEPDGAEASSSEEDSSARPKDSGLDAWLDDKQADEEQWRTRLAEYQRRFTEKKQRLAGLQRVEAQCGRDAMPVGVNQPIGNDQAQVTWGVGHVTCEKIPSMIAGTRKQMKTIRPIVRPTRAGTSLPRHKPSFTNPQSAPHAHGLLAAGGRCAR
jgi:hypothetical protein